MKSIKDLIYFDLEKAKSLISQLSGGLISEISRAFEDENEVSSGIGIDIKLVKANVGGRGKERLVKTEKSELYHELLNEIEKQLLNNSLLTNINNSFDLWQGSYNGFMGEIHNMNYIKASGWGIFEDFERFKHILSNYNEVQRLIYKAQLDNSPELLSLRKQLSDARKLAHQKDDRNVKSRDLAQIRAFEKKIDSLLENNTGISFIDEDFISGVKTFLNTFTPKRLNFRLLPLDNFNEFQILANLKDKYIIDGDFESIIYTYGTRPNVKLTVVGIITSAPRQQDVRVDPNDEFLIYSSDDLSDVQGFDKAFRNMFSTFENFEKLFYVPAYPKIAISPIAIYREVILGSSENN
ncbi:DUF6414 family protein [Hymenobacter defluvii]|uniref:Uncharacterized protein n=1 Tax=Hymenobacter defluvii TaxID=2054411 RepID=A0ABS3T7H5_9BACT|nr:hypothetical protein [Hymenobacter defluvii]MBO3269587.1 hypothetical protein [Hymenobacter defluvii]